MIVKVYVTDYEKRNHFMKIEFLMWVDSSVCVEYKGEGFNNHKPSYDHFYVLML